MTRVVDKVVIMTGDDKPREFQYLLQGRAEGGELGVQAVVNGVNMFIYVGQSIN